MIVTSGAIAFGKQLLYQQNMLSRSIRQTLKGGPKIVADPRACSAAGQGGLIAMYETMFAQYGITCAQILVTKNDFKHRSTVDNLRETINELLLMNVIPIINENDAISPPGNVGADIEGVLSVTDNDSLAANMAVQLNADAMLVLSDVDGIFRSAVLPCCRAAVCFVVACVSCCGVFCVFCCGVFCVMLWRALCCSRLNCFRPSRVFHCFFAMFCFHLAHLALHLVSRGDRSAPPGQRDSRLLDRYTPLKKTAVQFGAGSKVAPPQFSQRDHSPIHISF